MTEAAERRDSERNTTPERDAPPMLTLGQAAKESGVSKTAISRAIKSGRLSATRNGLGEYQIDPAELFRVYPVTVNVDGNQERDATPKDYSGLQAQLETLRELLRQIEGERDDLRRRLDEEAEDRRTSAGEIRRLTLLITHQPPPQDQPPAATPRPWPTPLTYWLAGIVALLGLVVIWQVWTRQL